MRVRVCAACSWRTGDSYDRFLTGLAISSYVACNESTAPRRLPGREIAMNELLQHPQPPPSVIQKLMASPTIHIAPGMIVTQDGEISGHLGPEAAGAVLMLQATFTDETKAAAFWDAAFP